MVRFDSTLQFAVLLLICCTRRKLHGANLKGDESPSLEEELEEIDRQRIKMDEELRAEGFEVPETEPKYGPENDIIDENNPGIPMRSVRNRRKRFSILYANKAFKYSFDFDKYESKNHLQIVRNFEAAIKYLEKVSCLRFHEVERKSVSCDGSTGRICRHSDPRVYFIKALKGYFRTNRRTGKTRCNAFSYPFWGSGMAFYWLSCMELNSVATVLHETLHGLGVMHEQCNPSKYLYLKVHSRWTEDRKSLYFTEIPYDHASFMHYAVQEDHRFNWNGKEKINFIALDDWYQSTIATNIQSAELNFIDKKYLNLAYRCNQCDDGEIKCENQGFPNVNNCAECVCPEGFSGIYCDEMERNKDRESDGKTCGKDGNKKCTRCPSQSTDRLLLANYEWQTLDGDFGPGSLGQQCTWYIKSPKDTRIEVQIEEMYLKSHARYSCPHENGGTWVELKMGIDPRTDLAEGEQKEPDFERTGYRLCFAKKKGTRRSIANFMIVKSRYNAVNKLANCIGDDCGVAAPFEFAIRFRSVDAIGAFNYNSTLKLPQVCVDETQNCAHYNSPICKSSIAYIGRRAKTVHGVRCQSWESQYPHSHIHSGQPSNYCRNPDGDSAPWCYTLDPEIIWDFCFDPCVDQCAHGNREICPTAEDRFKINSCIMTCEIPCKFLVCVDRTQDCAHYDSLICKSSRAYNGRRAKTVDGVRCQPWESQYFHEHSISGQPSNYCRNPDGAPAPWCYTTDPAIQWNFCFQPCDIACIDRTRDCAYYDSSICKSSRAYMGRRAKTVGGVRCQPWGCQYPHIHAYSGEPSNYCRNPDDEPAPWCYTTDPAIRWDFCFDPCDHKQFCVDETRECAHYNSPICKCNRAYNGSRAKTVDGVRCQSWGSQYPHRHGYSGQPSNYCRNPDGAPAPWCYTIDLGTRWDFCFDPCDDVPFCVDETQDCAHFYSAICESSRAYNGRRAKTVDGVRCQSWGSQYPHKHSFSGQPSNFCRNPDGNSAPWCYTTDPWKEWDFCFKPCDYLEKLDQGIN